MEAALRSAHFLITGKNPVAEEFAAVRSSRETKGYMAATYKIGDAIVKVAVVNGLANAANLIEKLLRKEEHFDFVEVMACPGGCVGGGGQPIHDSEELSSVRAARLYELDAKAPIRFSHENPSVAKLYKEFLKEPNSHLAHAFLHTTHRADGF